MAIYLYRSAIFLLSAFGISSVLPIAYAQWTEQLMCPQLGMFPACYIVLFAYVGMLIALVLPITKARCLFILSWSTVLLLALVGIFGEITNLWSCPETSSGIPKCFLSALLALTVGSLFWRYNLILPTKSGHP